MRHVTLCKIIYGIYSIPTTILLRCKGVKTGGFVFSAGLLYLAKEKGSEVVIGEKCRFMNLSIGNLIGLSHRCIIATGSKCAKLIIGNNCSFSGVSIWCFEKISIGKRVRVGANVLIMDGDAHQDDPRAGANAPIVIEDNVWIGGNTIVLKGVTIGKNSVIGAGSIVTHNIPENVVAAGNPCKVIKPLSEDVIRKLEEQCI